MSVLYCTIPHFVTALAGRDDPNLQEHPLVLIGPIGRVFGVSAEAAARGVLVGMTTREAEVRCPEARLLDADVARCRGEFESLLDVLEHISSKVEPHGLGAAYLDLGDGVQECTQAVTLCQQVGRVVRRELGRALEPAIGWNKNKFTSQTAARRTRPGHLLAIDATRERPFLKPLPVSLLPLPIDILRRLQFLGLRTLGQYAALPSTAVLQQFGRPGQQAHRYAQGKDNRPVVPRWQAPHLTVSCDLEAPLVERERLLAALRQAISPALVKLRDNLQACGHIRLTVEFADRDIQERARTFLSPTADQSLVMRALDQLLDKMPWHAAATALTVMLEQIQDVVVEQLTLFSARDERERKLQEAQRYLVARFGSGRLRRAILSQPGAPLPGLRVSWVEEDMQ